MAKTKKGQFKAELIQTIVASALVLVGLVIATAIFLFLDKFDFTSKQDLKQAEKIEKLTNATRELAAKIETPYEELQSMKKTTILENFENTTFRGNSTKWFTKNLKVEETIKSGYLYVKASVNDNPLNSNGYVYVKLKGIIGYSYHEYGGHLIQRKSLETPQSDQFSELLYKLSDVKYKQGYYDSDLEVISADWLSLLNAGNDQQTIGFTSTVGKGKIIELSFYYDCIESETCSIEVL